MTWMSGDQPWLGAADNMRNRAAFDDLARSIATVILRRQNLAVSPKDFVPPPWLISLIESWGKVGATVITLNYDLLVEKTFEATINATSLYLYSFPMANVGGDGHLSAGVGRFRLLKLHGSISWYVFSGLTGPVSPVYDAEFNHGWAMGPEKEADLLQRVGGRVPLIVPPVLGKDSYLSLPELRDQWLRAEMALRQAGRVFLLGYRLPHTDLPMRFLLDRTPEDCTIIPVNTDAEVATRIEADLQSRTVSYEYSGTSEPIAAFASDYSPSS